MEIIQLEDEKFQNMTRHNVDENLWEQSQKVQQSLYQDLQKKKAKTEDAFNFDEWNEYLKDE
jgi:hypothetical protein